MTWTTDRATAWERVRSLNDIACRKLAPESVEATAEASESFHSVDLERVVETRRYGDHPREEIPVVRGTYDYIVQRGLFDDSDETATGNIEFRPDAGLVIAEPPRLDSPPQTFCKALNGLLPPAASVNPLVWSRDRTRDWVTTAATDPDEVKLFTPNAQVRSLSDLGLTIADGGDHLQMPLERAVLRPFDPVLGQRHEVRVDADKRFWFPADEDKREFIIQQFESHVVYPRDEGVAAADEDI